MLKFSLHKLKNIDYISDQRYDVNKKIWKEIWVLFK